LEEAMMDHSEALGLLEELKRGALTPLQAARVQAHLDACPDCRVVALRWPNAAPVPPLDVRVMAQLREENAPRRAWVPSFAAAAALLLVLTAFWRPERAWVRLDEGFELRLERPAQGGR
jgi:predicted anti-sigma-YlaC factor YlaD